MVKVFRTHVHLSRLVFWVMFGRVVSGCVARCVKSYKDRVVIVPRDLICMIHTGSGTHYSSWRLVGVLLTSVGTPNSWSSRLWSCNCCFKDQIPWIQRRVDIVYNTDRRSVSETIHGGVNELFCLLLKIWSVYTHGHRETRVPDHSNGFIF